MEAPQASRGRQLCIYLFHYIAIVAVATAVHRLGLPSLLIFPIGLGAGVAAGVLVYLGVEAPMLSYFRRQKYRKGFPVPAGV